MSAKPSLYIALSLGHNASAVGIADGKIIAAYEQERFTREKSSSKFAKDAINKIIELYQPSKEVDNYFVISHWYDDFDFTDAYHEKINKHYNYDLIEEYKNNYNFKIVKLDENFTHHDAHAVSVLSFFMNHCTEEQYHKLIDEPSFVFVLDGFGNNEEVVTTYTINLDEFNNIRLSVADKIYGYENSLGLMYQYATSFVGMKENEDEYKFLGYESKIRDLVGYSVEKKIETYANQYAHEWFDKFYKYSCCRDLLECHNSDGKYINVDYLMTIKALWHHRFADLLENLEFEYPVNISDVNVRRSIVGHYIQTIIEIIHTSLLNYYKASNVLVSGGLYYNVKLNNSILKTIPGFLCAGPLAGDQGAAIGLYVKNFGEFPYYDLTWGYRELSSDSLNIPEEVKSHVELVNTKEELIEKAFNYLKNNHIVQVVTGNMEFGPRALCNTSTLSVGYDENVDLINSINGRNTVMPFAPVTIPRAAYDIFDNAQMDRIVGSLGYMIVTVDYKPDVMNNVETFKIYRGVANPYPGGALYSGRPQIIQDENSYIFKLIDKLYRELGIGAIINTSLNVHGKPIVYTAQDAIDDLGFNLQMATDKGIDKSKIHLLIYDDKKN